MPSSSAAAETPLELARPTSVRWQLIGMLMVISFMNHFNRISMSVAGKELIREQVFSEAAMGWIYAVLLYTYTLCMTPGGWLSDRAGGRLALCIVGMGAGSCAILTGLSLQIWKSQDLVVNSFAGTALFAALLLVRGVMGGCIAPIYPGSGAVVSRWLPFRQRATAMALITGAAPLGIACTFVVFPKVIERLGLPAAFYVLGALTITLALCWLWLSRNRPEEHPRTNLAERRLISSDAGKVVEPDREHPNATAQRDAGSWRRLLTNRSLWLITLSYGALGYMEYLQFYWSDYYFTEVKKFEGIQAQIACVGPFLLMCLSMPLGGWLSDRLLPVLGYRYSRAVVAGLGMVGSAAALAAATFFREPNAIIAGFALSLGFIGLSEGPCWATAIDLGKQRGGTSAGIFNTGGNGFGALAPIVTPWVKGLLVERGGMETVAAWGWALRLGCLICLAGAILWIWIDPADEGHSSSKSE